MTKIAYIDGSGSTRSIRKFYDALGRLYQDQGWQVYEFSTQVRPWSYFLHYGEGTNPRAILEHLVTRVREARDTSSAVTDVVVITDGDLTMFDDLDNFRDFCPTIVQVSNQQDYMAAYKEAQKVHRSQSKAGFTEAIRENLDKTFLDEIARGTQPSDLFGPITLRDELTDELTKVLSTKDTFKRNVAGVHLYRRAKQAGRDDIVEQVAKLVFNIPSITPSRPQEAPMNARPTIVTTVSLDRSRATEQPTIGDLKTLIAEVERVGGDDTSLVRLDQDSYRWNVTLSVKANEVEAEVALSPEQENLLLAEYRTSGTTKARKAEIKTLLGL